MQKYSTSVTLLFVLLAVVYGLGLFLPLMENDSAQHATMAMDMYLRNDFTHLFKAFAPYKDKPHLHFWLAALSYKFFGIHVWAYRLPAFLFTVLGAISCSKLTQLYYTKKAGSYAALVFLTAQAILLANHDVRTDMVLTGATIFSIWQWLAYLNVQKLKHALLAAIGMGLAFSSKGQLGVFVIATVVGTQVLYERKLKLIFSWKILLAFIVLSLSIAPVLYAYYLQFGTEGIQFILWDQSFNRITATGYRENSPDYFFFFHTLLWAFFPWALFYYAFTFKSIKTLITSKFKKIAKVELFSSLGVLLVLLVISTSKTKLPHYLNSILPVAAVLVAGNIASIDTAKRKILGYSHLGILALGYLLICVLFVMVFPNPNLTIVALFCIGSILTVYNFKFQPSFSQKILHTSILASIAINIFLNGHFYPNLLQYQSGLTASKIIKEKNIAIDSVYKIDNIHTWSLDYNNQHLTATLASDSPVENYNNKWLYLTEKQLEALLQRGLVLQEKIALKHYRITRLKAGFLNPKTREKNLQNRYLVKI